MQESLSKVLEKHTAVFKDGLGTAKDVMATLQVDPAGTPKFYKARSVSFAIRQRVEAELDRLQAAGTPAAVTGSWYSSCL